MAGRGLGVPQHGSPLTVARPPRLREFLEDAADLLVVLAPGSVASSMAALGLPETAQFAELVSPVPRPRDRDAVLLAVHDLAALRRAASALGNLGAAHRVGIWIERETTRLPSVTPAPEWPPLDEIVASRRGDKFVLLTFSSPVQVRPVLLHMARAASATRSHAPGWPTIGAHRDQPRHWPVADPAATVALPGRLFDGSVDAPPDLVLTERSHAVPPSFTEVDHHVLGRAPRVTQVEQDLTWEAFGTLTAAEAEEALQRRGPLSLGAVDEHVVNPIGFARDPLGEPVPLQARSEASLAVAATAGGPDIVLDADRGVSEADLPALRRLPGVRLDWDGGRGPQSYCRVVAGLAMAGVPLVTGNVPAWARKLLAPELVGAFGAPDELTDRLLREERSVRIRRAALRNHASGPWRRALAEAHELQSTPPPRISVLMVTRRPDMVPFALRQVARQRGVDFEVVLATHGFEADSTHLCELRERGVPVTVLSADSSLLFGEVLNQAAEHASGDVLLKMDDDDWYGPDFAADLLLARGYSGAEIVGCPAEFTFVAPLWLTTRRPDSTEIYRPFVAGGTMMIDRAAFRTVGGFRHTRKYVDANLLRAVTDAGGSVYRSHGLGYVLRRGSQGHTWDPGLGYFVKRKSASVQWRGFRPSSILDADPADLPSKPAKERLPS